MSEFQFPTTYSILKVLKQDERTLQGQFLTLRLQNLQDGPSNQHIFIAQQEARARKDSNNNFSSSPQFMQFSSINAFGVTHLALNMFENDMKYLKSNIYTSKNQFFERAFKIWQKRKPIGIFPHTQPDKQNAYYTRGLNGGEIYFHSFTNKYGWVHTSRSFDVIAHEVGHAILDNLRPDFSDAGFNRLQTLALDESFGDLTALFTILNIKVLRDDLLSITNGNLHDKSFLPTIAEDFNNRQGLRNASNRIRVDNVKREEHALSQVFTGAIYDILAQSFDQLRRLNPRHSKDRLLEEVQIDLRHLVLRAFIEVPHSNPSFSDVGQMLLKIAMSDLNNFGYIYDYILSEFLKRGIDITRPHTDYDWFDEREVPNQKSVCGTLRVLKEQHGDFLDFNPYLSERRPKTSPISNYNHTFRNT